MAVKKISTLKKDSAEVKPVEEQGYSLLAGYKDKEGVLHKDFEVEEMTGAEEEAISKPDIKINGAKVIRTVIERCCVRIGTLTKKALGQTKWREVIQNLYVGDQDIIMMKIRVQSVDDEIAANYDCPECKAKLKVYIKADELETIPFKGDDEIDFELPRGYKDKNDVVHKIGKLRIPIGIDRELLDPIARKNIGEANTLMLTRCITEFDGVNVTNDIVRGMSVRDRNYLFELLKDNMFGISLETDVSCNTCGAEFKASLNMENFL